MHELSLLVEVVRIVEDLVVENKIKKLKAIVLQVGEVSSVIPTFMEEYFPVVTLDKPFFKDTKLEIEMIPGEAKCLDCAEVFNIVKTEGYCPKCNSFEKEVLSGREFLIKELVVYDEGELSLPLQAN
jgi:hydrogenase nickel incorporation protein HypA/HybF